jgi:hypothetical protein
MRGSTEIVTVAAPKMGKTDEGEKKEVSCDYNENYYPHVVQ